MKMSDGHPSHIMERETSCARERVPVHLWRDGWTAEEDSMPIYATYIIPNDEATWQRVRGLADDCGVEVLSFDRRPSPGPAR